MWPGPQHSFRRLILELPSFRTLNFSILKGDSGGGGFSQEDDTLLLGIISARLDGQGAVFESVYPHVEWLRIFQN